MVSLPPADRARPSIPIVFGVPTRTFPGIGANSRPRGRPAFARARRTALAAETRDRLDRRAAPVARTAAGVITLRDVEGFTAAEVCLILDISPANQRVLLHRARAFVREELDRYFSVDPEQKLL